MSDVLRGCRCSADDATASLERIGQCLVKLQRGEQHDERLLSLKNQAQLLLDLDAIDERLADIADWLEGVTEEAGDWDGPVAEPISPGITSPLVALAKRVATWS
jgi:hypothetical protein